RGGLPEQERRLDTRAPQEPSRGPVEGEDEAAAHAHAVERREEAGDEERPHRRASAASRTPLVRLLRRRNGSRRRSGGRRGRSTSRRRRRLRVFAALVAALALRLLERFGDLLLRLLDALAHGLHREEGAGQRVARRRL